MKSEVNIEIPKISATDMSLAVVQDLLRVIQQQADMIKALKEEVQELKDEIARLKGHNPKPKIKPSTLEVTPKKKDTNSKRPGSAKKSKKVVMEIHETIRVKPDNLPDDAIFKGIREFDVGDIRISAQNTRYEIEEWVDASGKAIEVVLPFLTNHPHFGAELVAYILYQYHHCHVTQPLLLEQLAEWGVAISAGQISAILTSEKALAEFHGEKQEILTTGIEISSYVQTDDTGARHDGKNGYCTYLGNDLFAWFQSTGTKSRINFLQLLQGGVDLDGVHRYIVDNAAIDYMKEEKLPANPLQKLRLSIDKNFETLEAWEIHLKNLGITKKRHVRVATKAVLYAGCLIKGLRSDLIILSDDAGQFNVPLMRHALCWIHAERLLKKIVPITNVGVKDLDKVLSDFWDLYRELREYRRGVNGPSAKEIQARFDELFLRHTSCETLNQALKRLYRNKSELLLVLNNREIPLHNNTSESDIREES
jgi:FtsZ-binding cell division protein ZapB